MNNVIKDFLMKHFKEVTDVKFVKVNVRLGSDDRDIVRNQIRILITPEYILDGNFDDRVYFSQVGFHKEICDSLNNMFNLDLYEYGSEWGVRLYVLDVRN